MRMTAMLASVVLLAACTATAVAEEKVEVVLKGLDNPCGVAIQPGTGHVFVSDSAAGRVIRAVDGKAEDVVTGFPLGSYGKGPVYAIGPLGLLFTDAETLVVGGGGVADGTDLIRVYSVSEAGSPAKKVDDTKAVLGPIEADGDIKAEGNFYALAATKKALFVTCNGDDTKGWVSEAAINGTKFGELKRSIATKEATQVDAPVGICVSPRGEIVVGQMGEITVPKDSLLTYYNAKGKKLLNLETGLFDITAVAFSPKGHVYALDFAWMDTKQGGLYRLDASGKGKDQSIKAVKIVSLDKPSAMAFGPDGELYITTFGTAAEGSEGKPGQLIKLAPGL